MARRVLPLRAPVGIEITQDGQPPLQVGLPLGRDLGAPRLGQQLVVAVDDPQRVRVVEAEIEMGADQGQQPVLGSARLREISVQVPR